MDGRRVRRSGQAGRPATGSGDDQALQDEVIRAIGAAGYGVELWPHSTSLAPYRASTGGPDSLLSPAHRPRPAGSLAGLRSCWHGRLYEPDGRIAPLTNTLDGHLA